MRIFATLILVIGLSTFSFACSCISENDIQEELNKSSAVFSIKVLKILENSEWNPLEGKDDVENELGTVIKAEITEIFKGEAIKKVVVIKGEGSNCDYYFKNGHDYLIYSYKVEDSTYFTNVCTRTNSLEGNEDIETLRGQ